MKLNLYLKSLIFLICAQVMVAINIVVSKLLLSSIPVLVLLEIRFLLASLVLIPLHYLSDARKTSIRKHLTKSDPKDWWFFIGQALSAGALFNCLMYMGLRYTDANLAGIITSALPALIAFLSWIFLGEKLSSQKAFCVVFATFGLTIIAVSKLSATGYNHSFFGDFIVLLALFPEAAYYILSKLHINKLPVFLTSSMMNALNAIVLLPAVIATPWDPSSINIHSAIILFIISISSGLFYVFWLAGSKNVDSVMASLSTAIMPLATVFFAWIILGEKLSLLQLLGMSLVVFSIALYARR